MFPRETENNSFCKIGGQTKCLMEVVEVITVNSHTPAQKYFCTKRKSPKNSGFSDDPVMRRTCVH